MDRSEDAPPTAPRPPLGERFLRWWIDDLPPIDGRLRFVFYAGLLLLTKVHEKSFFLGLRAYKDTDPETYHPRGLLADLGLTYVDPATVELVIVVTVLAWIAAAVGFATRFSAILTAAGVFFLHGLFLDTNAGNRTWYLPLYALIALCFASSRDTWSVDYHLRRKFRPGAPPEPGRLTLSRTGFARKLFLVAVVGFYLASGMSKLFSAGIAWADGRTLQYFAEGRDYFFTPLLAENLGVCAILSTGSLLIEVFAVVALLSPRLRLVFLVLWTLMHLGIRTSLGPWYGTNIFCFILLVDWGAAFRWSRNVLLGARLTSRLQRHEPLTPLLEEIEEHRGEPPPAPVEIGSESGLRTSTARFAATAGTAFLALMIVVAVARLEWWPLTKVDMYSSYYGPGIGADYPWRDYRSLSRIQEIARETTAGNRSRLAQKEIAFGVEVQLVDADGERLSLRDGIGVADSKQWYKCVVMPVIINDLLAKPDGEIEFSEDAPDTPSAAFLRRILPVIKRHVPEWVDYERVILTYEQEGPDAVLASLPLRESPGTAGSP